MKIQQLRYVVEIVRQGNHLSAAAEAVHSSQPGVSRQIQLLEAELGFEIFVRTRNRIIGLTEPGKHVLEVARRVVNDVSSLKSLKEEMSASDRGTLIVATTHTLARYILPSAIEDFLKKFPQVQLVLKQGDPEQICEMVDSGDADLAIGTETERHFANLVKLPWIDIVRSVVAKKGHPILKVEPLTLKKIAEYPIITYDPRYSGRRKVMSAFSAAGIEPKIVMSAVDADVSKTYVAMGLGIAIMATVSYDPARDTTLGARDASKLFAPSKTYITLRANAYLRPFALQFIRALAPRLTPNVVRESLRTAAARGNPPAVPEAPKKKAGAR